MFCFNNHAAQLINYLFIYSWRYKKVRNNLAKLCTAALLDLVE